MADDVTKIGGHDQALEAANQDCDVQDVADRFELSPIKARALMKLLYGNDRFALEQKARTPQMTVDAEIVFLEEALRSEIRRELEIARSKYGENFELLCIEGSWGDTIDDRKALDLLRTLNRTGSMYSEVICRV